MAGQQLKIYGERNTGTNYLSILVELNLRVEQLPGVVPTYVGTLQRLFPGREAIKDAYFGITHGWNLGWKHAVVAPTVLEKASIWSERLSFVTLTKNPYSWLLSLHRRPYHRQGRQETDLEDFIRSPWRTVGRENAPKILSGGPVELWNLKNSSYVRLQTTASAMAITYEELLKNPKQVLQAISDRFGYGWKNDKFVDYVKSTKDSNKDSNYYRDYYLNEKWRTRVPRNVVSMINKCLNHELMGYFKYEYLTE